MCLNYFQDKTTKWIVSNEMQYWGELEREYYRIRYDPTKTKEEKIQAKKRLHEELRKLAE